MVGIVKYGSERLINWSHLLPPQNSSTPTTHSPDTNVCQLRYPTRINPLFWEVANQARQCIRRWRNWDPGRMVIKAILTRDRRLRALVCKGINEMKLNRNHGQIVFHNSCQSFVSSWRTYMLGVGAILFVLIEWVHIRKRHISQGFLKVGW